MTRILPDVGLSTVKSLKKNGIIKIGTNIQSYDVLVGKVSLASPRIGLASILSTILKKRLVDNISLTFPRNFFGIVTKVELSRKNFRKKFRKNTDNEVSKILEEKESYTMSLTVYVTEKRKIQIGDKIAGRHGNKGIISKILPYADMPYLPNGMPFDMLLNPLGIPSRMNVGQIFEGLLNLAAITLKERYKLQPFDEMQQAKTSQIYVYTKLNEARKKAKLSWLFNPNYPGKAIVFDGRSGKQFDQKVAFGFPYILKLIHLVKDKIHSRVTGPYSLVLKQPLRGRGKSGGQRFGEMEVWAMEGFGAAYSLQELLTIKSDDVNNRSKVLSGLIKGINLPKPNVPEAFKVFILELQSLCFDVAIFTQQEKVLNEHYLRAGRIGKK
jgi:DNA-directed RNA polymerase subunit beta